VTKQDWHSFTYYTTGGTVGCVALLLYGVVDLLDKAATRFGVDLSTFASSDQGLVLHGALLIVVYRMLKLYAGWYEESLHCLYRSERKEDLYEEHG
jgi:hypothetical protein